MGLKDKLGAYKNVWRKAQKPTKDEFNSTARVCLAGMGFIGAVGFGIFIFFILSGL